MNSEAWNLREDKDWMHMSHCKQFGGMSFRISSHWS